MRSPRRGDRPGLISSKSTGPQVNSRGSQVDNVHLFIHPGYCNRERWQAQFCRTWAHDASAGARTGSRQCGSARAAQRGVGPLVTGYFTMLVELLGAKRALKCGVPVGSGRDGSGCVYNAATACLLVWTRSCCTSLPGLRNRFSQCPQTCISAAVAAGRGRLTSVAWSHRAGPRIMLYMRRSAGERRGHRDQTAMSPTAVIVDEPWMQRQRHSRSRSPTTAPPLVRRWTRQRF